MTSRTFCASSSGRSWVERKTVSPGLPWACAALAPASSAVAPSSRLRRANFTCVTFYSIGMDGRGGGSRAVGIAYDQAGLQQGVQASGVLAGDQPQQQFHRTGGGLFGRLGEGGERRADPAGAGQVVVADDRDVAAGPQAGGGGGVQG